MTNPTSGSSTPRGTHVCQLETARSFLARLMTALGHGLQRVRTARELEVVELVVGFAGSEVAAVIVSAAPPGVAARNAPESFDEIIADASWQIVAGQGGPTVGLRGGNEGEAIVQVDLDDGELEQLTKALNAARADHLHAAVADIDIDWTPRSDERGKRLGRGTKEWLYDLFVHLPSLCGVDHSAALILPDHGHGSTEWSNYIVGAELHFVRDDEPAPRHMVGLLIPIGDGEGGLIEAAIASESAAGGAGVVLFETATEARTSQWLRTTDVTIESHPRFVAPDDRPTDRTLVLLPLDLPETGPGFLALRYRGLVEVGEDTRALFDQLSALVSDALARSDLYRVPVSKLAIFDAFANISDGEPCRTRTEMVERLVAELYDALGAVSVAIGLLDNDPDDPALTFPGPQGWDLDFPRTIHYRTSDSLAALALRMDRQVVLAGGRQIHPTAPALRWNNTLYVNERTNRIADSRYPNRADEDIANDATWRPLADYYQPTTPLAVYAAVARPLKIGEEVVGVLAMDFDRYAPWDAYSGFAAEALYAALAQLVTSHLALLPEA